ncbi:hypothetical protein HD597_001369 [Nonomuraea thailandensis]|uniref:Uncharacterized protein n=1 Tax=Nonomuraea thailandensis TaxID=1188745 RepID=A0A9X2GBI5_9ACTN|nr:hypothetical protein [Nonomuraea thailandensis]
MEARPPHTVRGRRVMDAGPPHTAEAYPQTQEEV